MCEGQEGQEGPACTWLIELGAIATTPLARVNEKKSLSTAAVVAAAFEAEGALPLQGDGGTSLAPASTNLLLASCLVAALSDTASQGSSG